MKRLFWPIFLVLFLNGCSETGNLEPAMKLRQEFASGRECAFRADVTADYGENIYNFSLDCRVDKQGALDFTVAKPEEILGITGNISGTQGIIEFDDHILAFPTMADRQVTPVTASWVLMKALRSGYICAAGREGTLYRVLLDDTYQDNSLHLEAWLSEDGLPLQGDIFWNGCRILTVKLENFHFL